MDDQATLPYFVVDRDLEFLLALKVDPLARTSPPILMSESETALSEFSKPEVKFSALFINPAVDESHGIHLIKLALKSQPALPIFYIVNADFSILPENELNALMIRKVLLKPVRYSQLARAHLDAKLSFDPAEAMKSSGQHKDQLEQEAQASDADFLPISAAKFISGSSCFFDVYVRLKAGKFVKILQAGDAFSADRVKSYLDKGVEHFYLRKDAQEAYLKYCDKLTTKVMSKQGLAPRVKVTILANQGEEVLSFLKNQNANSDAVGHAEKFLDNVRSLSRTLNYEKSDTLKAFFQNAAAMEHGIGATMLSAFMLKPLGLATDKSVHVIGLASLLHDIGLEGMDPKFREEDIDKFTPEERVIFETHPDKGVAALSMVSGVDGVTLQAIWQHHERRSRTGFPQRIGSGAMNRVAEIVGIVDEYLKMIRRVTVGGGKVDLSIWFDISIAREFSPPVVEAFRTAFKI